ncbi:hypothetical protein [Plantactinospora sp. KBS50]|uniref:hypothetical protein n=1 Tax=Plantactinospora sp. KBS50 TaxID=2024580 RepID=UPI0012FE4457|nr:hypothetical protein [Plantactinospora sp. KBS50]
MVIILRLLHWVELANATIVYAENILCAVDRSSDLIHAGSAVLNQGAPVLPHYTSNGTLHIVNRHPRIKESLLRFDGAIPVIRVVASEDVLHTFLVKEEGLISELEPLA